MASQSFCTFSIVELSSSPSKLSINSINLDPYSSDYWIKWKKIIQKNGMLQAANAISKLHCKHCDRMIMLDRKLNKPWDLSNGSDEIYKPEEMDQWTEIVNEKLKSEFGRWPAVYNCVPKMSTK